LDDDLSEDEEEDNDKVTFLKRKKIPASTQDAVIDYTDYGKDNNQNEKDLPDIKGRKSLSLIRTNNSRSEEGTTLRKENGYTVESTFNFKGKKATHRRNKVVNVSNDSKVVNNNSHQNHSSLIKRSPNQVNSNSNLLSSYSHNPSLYINEEKWFLSIQEDPLIEVTGKIVGGNIVPYVDPTAKKNCQEGLCNNTKATPEGNIQGFVVTFQKFL